MTEPDRAKALIRAGLEAWTRGDLDALEPLLAPLVTLSAVQPGPPDCENRTQVMALLRARAHPARQGHEITVTPVDGDRFLVSGTAEDPDVATLVTITDGLVTSLRQVSTAQRDPDADAAVVALREGDLTTLGELLQARPDLARVRLPGYQGRTLLHIATDWPGYLAAGPQAVHLLIDHGADPNVRGNDRGGGETPLHWAASNDDVDVARALLDRGADPDAAGGSIGTPLDNAVGYGCWSVARLLADRGGKVDKLWHAAALGDLERLEELLGQHPIGPAFSEAVNQAFWHACAAAQRRAAERLLRAGARLDWVPDYAQGTALDAATGSGTRRDLVVQWLTELAARPAPST